jgi:hypothetical protein
LAGAVIFAGADIWSAQYFSLALSNRKALSEKGWSFRKSPFLCQGGRASWEALLVKGRPFSEALFLSGGRAY